MTPTEALTAAIIPALEALGEKFQGPRAEIMLLAIFQQESGLRAIQQQGGPARGLAQFEEPACEDVIVRPTSRFHAATFCNALGIAPVAEAVYAALLTNDVLAAGFARLKLWNMPDELPIVGDSASAWDYYLNCWHPGKPRPDSWPTFYSIAQQAVQGTIGG